MVILVWFAAGVLAVGALGLLAGAVREARRARLWWGALLASALAWLLGILAVMAAKKGLAPLSASGKGWVWPFDAVAGFRVWRLGENQQPFVLLALTLGWVVLLLDAVRAERGESEGLAWAALLAVGALAVPAVVAATPVAWVMFWVALDITALAVDVRRLARARHRQQAVWVFFFRSLSWFLALEGAVVVAHGDPSLMTGGAILWWGALGLRLTAAAFHPAVMAVGRPQWRLALAAVNTLATLAAMSELRTVAATLPGWMPWAAALLAWWGAVRWGAARTPMRAIGAGSMAFGGLALLGVAYGAGEAAMAWAWLAATVPVGMALAPHRGRLLWPYFAALALPVGLLPYTVGQAAADIWSAPFHIWMVLAWIALAAAAIALGRQGMRLPPPSEDEALREGRAFCLFGLVLWALVLWAGVFWLPKPGMGGWNWLWGVTALVAAAFWLRLTGRGYLPADRAEAWAARRSTSLVSVMFWGGYRLIGRTLRFFSLLLEGEGGVLWALVLLAMLAVLLQR